MPPGGRILIVLVTILAAAGAGAQETSPLAPLDTSSPRATYLSFNSLADEIQDHYATYRARKTVAGLRNINAAFNRARQLFDLSETPPATRDEIGGASIAYMMDILARLSLVAPETIPDKEEAPPIWRLPDTEIAIRRVEEGERTGAYLFSPETVERLPEFHGRIIDHDPVRPVPYRSWRAEQVRFTGPLFSYGLLKRFPGALQRLFLGTPVWKVALVVAVWLVLLALVVGWSRLARRLAGDVPLRQLAYKVTTPILLSLAALLMTRILLPQVNLSGGFAEATNLWDTALLYVGLAWASGLAVFLIVEIVIAFPAIPDDSYDAHLLRLLARVGALGAVAAVLVVGASELGIPALGLVAGLGVGGFALALAAQSTVENLFGGVSIFADRPFRVGDFINYGGATGVVEAIGPRSSRIRGLDGTLTTVPNADLAKIHITNYSVRNKCLFMHVIGLRYETSPAQFEWLLVQIRKHIAAHPMVEEDEAGMPRVRLIGFGESSIDVEVRAYVLTTNWSEFLAVQEDLILALMRIVDAAGSSFAFPSRTLYLGRDQGLNADRQARAARRGRRLDAETEDHAEGAEGPEEVSHSSR